MPKLVTTSAYIFWAMCNVFVKKNLSYKIKLHLFFLVSACHSCMLVVIHLADHEMVFQ